MLFANWFGTRERRLSQSAVPAAFSPRVSHFAATFANVPSELTMPPSEPSQYRYGLPGNVTIAC